MLISKTLSRSAPTGIARLNLLPRALSSPRPQVLPHAIKPSALTIQCLRHKSNRHGPKYPQQQQPQSNNSNARAPLSPRDLQYIPNRNARRPDVKAGETLQQAASSEATAEFDTAAQPARNTVPDGQPGPAREAISQEQAPSDQHFQDAKSAQKPFGDAQTERTAQQEASSEETAEFNSAARPESNTVPKAQPGPAQEPISKEQAPEDQHFQDAETSEPAAQKPLPDLRHGIPSTFAEEFLKQQKAAPESGAGETARDEARATDGGESASGSGREEGELPKSAYQTSIDKRRERMATWAYLGFGLMGVTGALFLGRNWDTEEEERAHMKDAPSGWGFSLFYDRVKARLSGQMGYYTEPTFPKLLPDIEPAPPYTLVLSLEDLMIHSEWTREHGWRTAKRPGVDYFLGYLSQYYELVLFTSLPVSAADQIVRKLDPYHFMTFPLFREATRYEKGQYVKDLSYLNRPLSKTILIDTKPEHAKAQPENAIILKPWKGESGDKELVSLLPFLEQIAAMQIPDVRAVLKSYEGKHIPTEFALRESKAREEFNRQFAEEQARKPKRSGLSWLNGALGMKPQPGGMTFDGQHSVAEGLAEGRMLADQIRETGIKRYRELEKEIRENGEKWLKEEAEMEKKMQAEQMKSMKSGALSFWGGGGGGGSAAKAV